MVNVEKRVVLPILRNFSPGLVVVMVAGTVMDSVIGIVVTMVDSTGATEETTAPGGGGWSLFSPVGSGSGSVGTPGGKKVVRWPEMVVVIVVSSEVVVREMVLVVMVSVMGGPVEVKVVFTSTRPEVMDWPSGSLPFRPVSLVSLVSSSLSVVFGSGASVSLGFGASVCFGLGGSLDEGAGTLASVGALSGGCVDPESELSLG
jgi:hypothetical protein